MGNLYSSLGEKGEVLTWGGKHTGSKSAQAEVEMCLWKACDSYSHDINRDVYVSFFFFLAEPNGMQDLNSHQGLKLHPIQWKCGVLTNGPPRKSQICMFPCFPSRLGRHNVCPSVYLRRAMPSVREGAPNSDHTLRITSRSLEKSELKSTFLGPGSESRDMSLLGNNPDKAYLDFPGGPEVKNPPVNTEDKGSIPGPGRCHRSQRNLGRVLQLLSPWALEPVLCNKRNHWNKPESNN